MDHRRACVTRLLEDTLDVRKDIALLHLFGVAAASDRSIWMNDCILEMESKDRGLDTHSAASCLATGIGR
jgi:hypothetical protein